MAADLNDHQVGTQTPECSIYGISQIKKNQNANIKTAIPLFLVLGNPRKLLNCWLMLAPKKYSRIFLCSPTSSKDMVVPVCRFNKWAQENSLYFTRKGLESVVFMEQASYWDYRNDPSDDKPMMSYAAKVLLKVLRKLEEFHYPTNWWWKWLSLCNNGWQLINTGGQNVDPKFYGEEKNNR